MSTWCRPLGGGPRVVLSGSFTNSSARRWRFGGALVGPTDLTASLHHHPHPRLKTLDDCVRHVVEAVAGTNTGVCLRTPFSEAQKYRDLGVNVLLVPPGG